MYLNLDLHSNHLVNFDKLDLDKLKYKLSILEAELSL